MTKTSASDAQAKWEEIQDEALSLVRKSGSGIRFPARVEILRQGDPPDKAYLLEEGLVVLKVVDGDGRECSLAYRRTGSFLGSASIITGIRYPMTVAAQTDIKVVAIPTEMLLTLMEHERAVSQFLHYENAREHYNWIVKASAEATLKARQRIEEFLWDWMAEMTETMDRFRLPFSDGELARFISVSPQHLCALLQELENAKLIKRSHGVFTIPDRSRLFHRDHEASPPRSIARAAGG